MGAEWPARRAHAAALLGEQRQVELVLALGLVSQGRRVFASLDVLLVEQNLAFALRVADRVHLMSKGRIVHECAPDELRRDEAIKARWLGI